ncbi:hypothetical protein NC653_040638 [Populus alba x Populus x berolinensis]|uniref:Uncharacterized protein n=1 Tax=Populus alba x Populus x berolinensis TaxID=444605 RepID=A0AAD6PN91_9ROSI|nr:hypothetical protein NC653_040638 [Populus alba x Populus x berolinensis]
MEDSSLDLQNDPFINKHHGNSNIIWTSQPVNALSGFSFVLLIASSNAIDGPDVRAEFEKAGINTHFIPFIRNFLSKLGMYKFMVLNLCCAHKFMVIYGHDGIDQYHLVSLVAVINGFEPMYYV